jgi:hypothetical protein
MLNSKWSETRNLDALGLLLQRFAGLLIGFAIGLDVAHSYPPAAWRFHTPALLVGIALVGLGAYRARTASEDRVELRTK